MGSTFVYRNTSLPRPLSMMRLVDFMGRVSAAQTIPMDQVQISDEARCADKLVQFSNFDRNSTDYCQ